MAEQPAPDLPAALTMGAQVYSADGHHVGKVIELLTDEFIVAAGLLGRQWSAFRHDAVKAATPDRVDLALAKDAIDQPWNEVELRDQHGHPRLVVQVGVPRAASVPFYDGVQTTTGGPPSGEADQ
ncbi:MAG TPA: hypothetical protein VKB76_13610 [Ktedonobacterales bacterium]|nr:hypothetical protein [Ktedonobacterales bacterium]